MRKVIAVAVPKGGVGKTTTAVNLSASLAIAEKKTLLIDFDPSGACSISLGFTPDKIVADIFDVFSFSKSIERAIHKTDLENLDFIPTNLANVSSEERLGRAADNAYLFRNILNQAAFNNYEYIIIDCPPYLRGLTSIALIASNSVLIPVRAGQFSISALKRIFGFILELRKTYNSRLNIEGILLNMYEPKTTAWMKTEIQLNELFKGYVLKTTIPKSTALPESEFYGKPAILVKAKSSGAMAYLMLANEIIFRNSVM